MSRKILIADGDQPTLELITAVMTRNGFQVQATHDGGDALSRFMEHEPELVVCGDSLPVVSGFNLCHRVKSEAPQTRVVLLLGGDLSAAERQAAADDAGCDAVLVRPFRFGPLKRILSQWGYGAGGSNRDAAAATALDSGAHGSFAVPAPPAIDPIHIAALAPPEPDALSAPGRLAFESPSAETASSADSMPIPLPLAMPGAELEPPVPTPLEPFAVPAAAELELEPEDDERRLDPALQLRPPEHQPPAQLKLELQLQLRQPGEAEPQEEQPASALQSATAADIAAARQALLPPEELPEQGQEVEEPALQAATTAEVAAAQQALPAPEGLSEQQQREEERTEEEPALQAATGADVARAREELLGLEEEVGERDQEPDEPDGAAAVPLAVPQEGDLAQLPLPRLLYELYMATFTGALHLSRRGLRRSVHLVGGFPVRVDSQQLSENLGCLLVEHGRITEAQYERARQLMLERGCRQGEALVEIAALRESELLQALQTQTERKLSNAFAWRDGEYAISEEQDSEAGGATGLGKVHPLKAIWQGVGEHYDAASLRTFYAALRQRYVVASTLFGVHYDTLGPFLRELDIGKLLDGSTTFAAALGVEGPRQADLCRALYVLLVTDMVMASSEPGEPVPDLSVVGAKKPAARAPAPVSPDVAAFCDRLAKARLAARNATYFKVLALTVRATAEQVEVAYQTAVAPLRPEALPAGLPQEVRDEARELATILTRARDTLCDPQRRARYVELLKRGRARAAAARPAPDSAEQPADAEQSEGLKAERAYRQGMKLLEAGDFAAAQRKLEEATALSNGEPLFHVGLGRAVLAAGDSDDAPAWRKAGTHFFRALQIDPSSVEGNLAMAEMLFQTDHWRTSRPYVLRVLQRAPENQEARGMLDKLEGIHE